MWVDATLLYFCRCFCIYFLVSIFHACFPPEGYPVSPVLYFFIFIYFFGLSGAADCLPSSLSDEIHHPTHCHCSVPLCLQQSHSHFQLSWLKIKTKHTQSLWRRLVPCYQCFRYLPLEPCTAIFTGRALLSGTAVSTEKLLGGNRKQVFIFIILVFFFLQQRASSLTNPFHLHSAIAVSCKVGFGIQHASTCTCAYTVGQKAALSCSCKKCPFIFYQRKEDNSLRLCSFHRKPQKFSRFSR